MTSARSHPLPTSTVSPHCCKRAAPNPFGACIHPPNTYGLLSNDGVGNYAPKPAYLGLQDLIVEIEGGRLAVPDETIPAFLSLVQGAGTVVYSPSSGAVRTDGHNWYGDDLWGVVNDYQDVPGLNVFVSNPGPPNSPACPGDTPPGWENSPWVGIHIQGLKEGAPYRVYLRYATIPDDPYPYLRGIRAHIPEITQWVVLDQNSSGYTVVRQFPGSGREEREVLLGEAPAEYGEIQVIIDDGSCTLYEALFTGLRLETALHVVEASIFADGFESGDTSAWSDTEP